MSLDDDIKQALRRHEGDVQAKPGAWREVERRVTRSHRARVIASSSLAVAAIIAIAVVAPRLGSSNRPTPSLTLPPADTNQPTPSITPTQPTTPQLLAKVPVPAFRLAAAGDSIWALGETNGQGTLVRINGSTDEVTARVDVGGMPIAVAAAVDQVWVARSGAVVRVDPSTNRVISHVAIDEPVDVAVSEGAVWVIANMNGDTRLVKVNPDTNRVASTYKLNRATVSSLAVGEGYVWVAQAAENPDGMWFLLRLDPSTGDVKNVTFDKYANGGCITTTTGAIWVCTTGETSASALERIDPSTMKAVARFELPDAAPIAGPISLSAGEGYLWATGERGQFWKADPIHNAPVGDSPINIGEAPPEGAGSVVTGFGAVWVASDDGHIWKFAP